MIALSIMIFTTTASVLSGLRSSPGAFAGDEGFVISSSSAPTVFSSQVDADIDEVLSRSPNITGSSPEIFAFASFSGTSFVIRGVDMPRLGQVTPLEVEDVGTGDLDTSNFTRAYVGSRLLERLDISLPKALPVTGSYQSRIAFLGVVGWFRTGTSMDDEMLVSLDMARFLSGMPAEKVSIVRVTTDDPEWLEDLLSPESARFALFDLHCSETAVALGEPVTATVNVRNWGASPGTASVTIRFGETLQEPYSYEVTTSLALAASEERLVVVEYEPDAIGSFVVQAGLIGDFPVELNTTFQVVLPYLRISSPTTVVEGSQFNVTVTTYSDAPATGATVTFAGSTEVTGSNGTASFTADTAGSYTITASLSGFVNASWPLTVADPSSLPDSFQPVIEDFSVFPESVRESEDAIGRLVVVNEGIVEGNMEIDVTVDQGLYVTLDVSLSALEARTVEFVLSGLSAGTHTVQVGTWAAELTVVPWFADDPDLVELVVRYGGTSALTSASSIPIYQAAKISEGNVSVALLAIGAISGLLALLAITSVFSKELHEARRRLGVLKTIGASRAAVRRLVLPQALETGLGGTAIGIGLGVVVADTISKSGALFLFGHEVSLELDAGLMVLILVSSIAISVASALATAMIASRETAISSIKRLEEQPGEAVDVGELIRDA